MARQFEMGVVSMAKREEVEFVLELTDLKDCFSVIVTAEEVSNHKPDPECDRKAFQQIDLVRIAQGHLPITHGECVVIKIRQPELWPGGTRTCRFSASLIPFHPPNFDRPEPSGSLEI